MRFPDNPTMARTFDLFRKHINFTLENKKLNKYYMSTKTDKCLYNDISAPSSSLAAGAEDVFGFSVGKGGTVPAQYYEKGYAYWIGLKIDWIRDELKKDFNGKGWDALMSVDKYSMRSYMSLSDKDPSKQTYPNSVCVFLNFTTDFAC